MQRCAHRLHEAVHSVVDSGLQVARLFNVDMAALAKVLGLTDVPAVEPQPQPPKGLPTMFRTKYGRRQQKLSESARTD